MIQPAPNFLNTRNNLSAVLLYRQDQSHVLLSFSALFVVALLTGDDEVRARLIKSEFYIDDENNKEDFSFSYQPRPNVVFEIGMALSDNLADRTILVEVGDVSICQMLKGRDRVKLSNQWKHRWRFIQSLETAGCSVTKSNLKDIRDMGNFDIEY